MYCIICDEDINKKGQDNVSPIFGKPICNDCMNDLSDDDLERLQEPYDLD